MAEGGGGGVEGDVGGGGLKATSCLRVFAQVLRSVCQSVNSESRVYGAQDDVKFYCSTRLHLHPTNLLLV